MKIVVSAVHMTHRYGSRVSTGVFFTVGHRKNSFESHDTEKDDCLRKGEKGGELECGGQRDWGVGSVSAVRTLKERG